MLFLSFHFLNKIKSNTGIGKEAAKDFAKRGARLILACRTVSAAEEVKGECRLNCND